MKDVKITITSSEDLLASLTKNRISKFGEHKIWSLDSSNLQAAANAISSGDVVGIAISPDYGFKFNGLSCLADLPQFNLLVTSYPEKLDVSYIDRMPHLTHLSLGGGQTVPCDLNALKNLQYLGVTLDKKQKLPIQQMPNLKELKIWNLPDPDASALQVFPHIQALEIFEAKKLTSLMGIEGCKSISKLVVAYCPKLFNISAISALKYLDDLDLQNTKLMNDYAVLAELTQLKKLMIDKSGPISTLNFASHLKKLEHLVIRSTRVEDCDLSPLMQLPLLSHTYLDKKKEYEPVASELQKLVQSRKNEIN
jgi:hypothetical protein